MQLIVQAAVDQVLIAVQLGRIVTTNALEEVGRAVARLVKRITLAEVQYAEIGFILAHDVFSRGRGQRLHLYGIGKGGVIEVMFVDLPQIKEANDEQANAKHPRLDHPAQVKPQEADTYQYNKERTQS